MITADQRPTGTPGTAPRGPAGPGPEPRSPKPPAPKPNTQKPPAPSPTNGTGGPWPSSSGPSAPSGPTGPGRLIADLEHAELLLLAIGRMSMDRFAALDPAVHHQLNTGLRTALLAVSAAQSPARQRPRTSSPYCFCPALLVGHEFDPQYCKDSDPAPYVPGSDRPMLPVRPTKNVEPEVAVEDGVARGVPSGARFRAANRCAGEPPLPGVDSFSLPRRVDLPTFEVGVGPLYDVLPAVNGSLARRAD